MTFLFQHPGSGFDEMRGAIPLAFYPSCAFERVKVSPGTEPFDEAILVTVFRRQYLALDELPNRKAFLVRC